MVNYSETLDRTFGALADPTRRAILARLASGEFRVTELARPFEISLPAVSKHLKVLEEAGLLARRKDGRIHHCRLDPRPMNAAAEWIARHREFWENAFDNLEKYLVEQKKEAEKWRQPNRNQRRQSVSRGSSRRAVRKSSAPGPTRKR